jgi:secondary thiamine-phosphate synthase enzyme
MRLSIQTNHRQELIDITSQVEQLVAKNKVKNGHCLVFVAHSTAAIILTENESGLVNDWLKILKKLVAGERFEHDRIDNNADSHLLSGFLGQGKTIPVKDGRLVRGTWQQIFLVELDGPRQRKITITFT